jgi:hypothetical protein
VIRNLLDVARRGRSRNLLDCSSVRADEWESGSWAWKNTARFEPAKQLPLPVDQRDKIVAEIGPGPRDIVHKQPFCRSNLAHYLVQLEADSLILAGTRVARCDN